MIMAPVTTERIAAPIYLPVRPAAEVIGEWREDSLFIEPDKTFRAELIIASREIRCQLVSIFAPAAPLCSLITQLLVVVHNGVQCNGESCERVLKEKPELCVYY